MLYPACSASAARKIVERVSFGPGRLNPSIRIVVTQRRFLSCVLALAVAGCGSDPAAPPEASYTIAIHGGGDQQGPAGSILDEPLQVTVSNVENDPVQGVVVRFRVLSGGGSLTDSIGVTGPGGIAITYARVGSTVGPQVYEAAIRRADQKRVTFEATATDPARLTRISSGTNATAGDTVDVVGENFNTTPGGNAVFFGVTRARILAVEGDTLLRVIVPYCATAGLTTVQVQVGTATTNTIPVSYTAATTLNLAVGEGITIGVADLERCVQIPAMGPRYLVVPQFAGTADDPISTPFRIGRTTPTAVAAASPLSAPLTQVATHPATAQERIDRMMRRLERDIAPAVAAQDNEPDAVVLQALELNSIRRFQVISDLGTDGASPKFATSISRLRYIGDHILIYVDERSVSALTATELNSIGELFDNRLYALAANRFGSESDLDANGKVIVLMTPYVNGLVTRTECQQDSFVAGYFYPNDLYLRNANSNKGEIFYTLVPDPAGTYSCPHGPAFIRRLIPGTFIHEFQHMISFNQHVLARSGSSEDVWLNEGLSLIAEETAGRYYEERFPPQVGQVFSDSAAMFLEEIMLHAFDYIFASKAHSVTTFDGFGDLEERGAAWLFLRWLGDQKGDQVYSRLVQTRTTSIENVQGKTGENFAALFGDFALAVAADVPGFARTTLAPRYRFAPRPNNLDYRTLFQRISEKYGKPVPNPVGCSPGPSPVSPPCTQLQPHATATPQSMVQGTMAFYNLSTTTITQPTIGLLFTNSTGGPLSALLVPQVGIVRVQ